MRRMIRKITFALMAIAYFVGGVAICVGLGVMLAKEGAPIALASGIPTAVFAIASIFLLFEISERMR